VPPIISPAAARTMTTRELLDTVAGTGVECALPTMPDATQVVADLVCAACPLTAVCRELKARDTKPAVRRGPNVVDDGRAPALTPAQITATLARCDRSTWGVAA
jgi:hypothetical protein